jgi:hypothetical protein
VIPTQLKKPMAERSTPASLSHADSVENTNKNGSPAEKPKNTIVTTRRWAYTDSAVSQLFDD